MSHQPELLSAMLDGELSEDEGVWVAAHLEGCGRCRSELEDLASARAAVRGLPFLDLPVELVPEPAPVHGRWGRRVTVGALSAAAVAVLALGVLGMVGALADSPATVDVGQAEAILAATESLGVAGDGSEAARYATSGADAHYRARQTVACRDDGTMIESTVDVTRMGPVTVLSDPLSQLTVLTDGSVATGEVTGPIDTVTVTGPGAVLDDYSVVEVVDEMRHDRETKVVTLAKDGVARARLSIDVATGVIVHRELLAVDGSVSCVADLVEFEPSDEPIQASIPFDFRAETTEMVYDPVNAPFPATLADLDLVAAYPVEGGEVGVYGDGIFSMAVMRVEGGSLETTSSDPAPAEVWEADGMVWAILGPVPSDMVDAARGKLPEPSDLNPVARGWKVLFG